MRIALALAGLLVSCGSVAMAAECPAGALASATGSGAGSSMPFHTDSPFAVKWSTTGKANGLLQISVSTKDGELLGLVANQTDGTPGSSYVPKAGDYYISVNAVFLSGGGSWHVCVVPMPD